MFCFTPPVPLNAHPRTCAVCHTRPPRMMAEFNTGEDYIRQLSKQSTENARRRVDKNVDAPNPYPGSSQSQNRSPDRGGASNTGEEYIQQLARNTTENAHRRSEAFAEERRQSPSGSSSQNTGRERALAELDKLTKEAEALEQLLKRQEKIAREEEELEKAEKIAELEKNVSPEQLNQEIADIEARLAKVEQPRVNQADTEIAEIEAKLAARVKSSIDPNIVAYDEMREKLGRSVTTDEEPIETRFVEEEPRLVDEKDGGKDSNADELNRMRRGMIELRLESERYASAARELQEKHEQMMRIIVENCMPGL